MGNRTGKRPILRDVSSARAYFPQPPALDGYESYASSYGTYDAASQVYAAANAGACFYYKTETGRVIGAYTYSERDPEYDELHELWTAAKDGG